jgi:hypothetical protein
LAIRRSGPPLPGAAYIEASPRLLRCCNPLECRLSAARRRVSGSVIVPQAHRLLCWWLSALLCYLPPVVAFVDSRTETVIAAAIVPVGPFWLDGKGPTEILCTCTVSTVPYRTVPYRTVPYRTVPYHMKSHYVLLRLRCDSSSSCLRRRRNPIESRIRTAGSTSGVQPIPFSGRRGRSRRSSCTGSNAGTPSPRSPRRRNRLGRTGRRDWPCAGR